MTARRGRVPRFSRYGPRLIDGEHRMTARFWQRHRPRIDRAAQSLGVCLALRPHHVEVAELFPWVHLSVAGGRRLQPLRLRASGGRSADVLVVSARRYRPDVHVCLVFTNEVVSQFPISGGLYPWARRLVGKRWAWMAGWIYGWALLVSIAAVATGGAPFVVQLLGFPVTPTNNTALALAMIALATACNVSGTRLLARVAMFGSSFAS